MLFSLFLLAWAAGQLSQELGVGAHRLSSRDAKEEWVTIWGSMPQLTEPANLPPEPYVSLRLLWLSQVRN
jgi:hypothetical protein